MKDFVMLSEGKFGQAKRRYGLNCIMTKLSETSETCIAITFLVINLSTLLRQVLVLTDFVGSINTQDNWA